MKDQYLDVICSLERIHKMFLEAVRCELEIRNIVDINNIQAMIIYSLNDKALSVGELSSRGYYLGTNISYNLKKIIKCGYIIQDSAEYDKRSSIIRVSEKGEEVCRIIDMLVEQQAVMVKRNGLNVGKMTNDLRKIEVFFGELFMTHFRASMV